MVCKAILVEDRFIIFHYYSRLFLFSGTGYEVTITRDTDNTVPLTNVIRSVIPNCEKKYESTFELVYKLPLTDTAKFPELFSTLEEENDNLAIVNISVSCTTMEQVFLK